MLWFSRCEVRCTWLDHEPVTHNLFAVAQHTPLGFAKLNKFQNPNYVYGIGLLPQKTVQVEVLFWDDFPFFLRVGPRPPPTSIVILMFLLQMQNACAILEHPYFYSIEFLIHFRIFPMAGLTRNNRTLHPGKLVSNKCCQLTLILVLKVLSYTLQTAHSSANPGVI